MTIKYDFSGKRVLVTGGGRGIGEKIATCFAAAGAAVGILDKDFVAAEEAVAAIRESGGNAVAAEGNLEYYEDCKKAVEKISRQIGHIDILINNAAISPKHEGRSHSVLEMDPVEWQTVMAVNLGGAFNMIKQVAPRMVEKGWGRIVNISSVGSLFYAGLAGAHYSASKAAINSLTRTLAGEFGSCGVTVNAIVPGRVATPMASGVGAATNESLLLSIPLGRFAAAVEVAGLVMFVASEEAAYMTGETIPMTGGLSLGSLTKNLSKTSISRAPDA
ncbi:MAG: SDR family NAD(P)-dependent oxidoreductase [Pseudomonadota bacterium]